MLVRLLGRVCCPSLPQAPGPGHAVTAAVLRCRPAELASLGRDPFGDAVAVVIDVLRMTTTAAVLMGRRDCAEVAVAATLADLERLGRPRAECLVVSELSAAVGTGPRIDNSPAQTARVDLAGRTPVLVTTNGTRTLLAAAACCPRVLLASFRDLRAVARHVAGGPVVVIPAGHVPTGERRLEDDLCADALAALLTGKEPRVEAMAALVRRDRRVRRRLLAEPGFSEDLALALEHDPAAVPLTFVATGPGVGRITRAD